VIPHITDEIKNSILLMANDTDVAIIEVGGTVGDIESLPFLEAIRQMKSDLGKENVLYIHLTLVPLIKTAGEVKTKPTQHSVKELRSIGIQPDILLCRTEQTLSPDIKAKIALFCNVEKDAVITAKDVESIYEVPLFFHQEGLDNQIVERLNIWTRAPRLENWIALNKTIKNLNVPVRIAIVGKYIHLKESYKSLNEALVHGGIANNCKVILDFVDSEEVEKQGAEHFLSEVDGVLVPGGFGSRGVEGKIASVRYARENLVPYFGICYGMHMAVIELARSKAGLDGANTTEVDPNTPYPIIYLMSEWFDYRSQKIERRDKDTDLGGTMRLGAYPCRLVAGTLAYASYQQEEVFERHRHRYEFNMAFKEPLTEKGLILSGLSPDGSLVEIVELHDHPWFLGCQFHPEFKSRPMSPHPLFREFIRASLEHSQKK
jgi:CTP synthase